MRVIKIQAMNFSSTKNTEKKNTENIGENTENNNTANIGEKFKTNQEQPNTLVRRSRREAIEESVKRTEAFDSLKGGESFNKLEKTKMCRNIERFGRCNRRHCTFAHSKEELRKKECFFGLSCRKEGCPFAHPKVEERKEEELPTGSKKFVEKTTEKVKPLPKLTRKEFPELGGKVVEKVVEKVLVQKTWTNLSNREGLKAGVKKAKTFLRSFEEEEKKNEPTLVKCSREVALGMFEKLLESGVTKFNFEITE